MTQATEKKIRRLVEEESINWLLNQFTCDEDDIFVSESLKEIFADKKIDVTIETLNYLTDLINAQFDKELEDADE